MKKEIKKGLKLIAVATKEKFESQETGEVIDYFAINVKVGNETFRLQVKKDDKRMLNHMLKEIFANPENLTPIIDEEDENNEDDL